jgi:hypothetical protein
MIERRQIADAHELLGADLDHRHSRPIVKMGNDSVRHAVLPSRFCDGGHSRVRPAKVEAGFASGRTLTLESARFPGG